MPISYALQPFRSSGLVRVTMTGAITAEALAPHLLHLYEQRLFGLPEIVDMRAARVRWSSEEMRWIARLVAVLRRRDGPAAVGVVIEEEDSFDHLVRYLLMAGDTDPRLGVFRDFREAEGWVYDQEFSSPRPGWASSSGPRALEPDRPPAAPSPVLGYARVRPRLARNPVGLDPTRWYPVTEQPADVLAPPLEGHVWLNDAGQVRRVPLHLLEVMWGAMSPPTGGSGGQL
jgi:hypothetical protein